VIMGQLHIELQPTNPPRPTHLAVTTADGLVAYIDLDHAIATLKQLEGMIEARAAAGLSDADVAEDAEREYQAALDRQEGRPHA
jgi:hypothetical protein